MLSTDEIVFALRKALPREYHEHIPALAQTLAEALEGTTNNPRLPVERELQETLLGMLAGQTLATPDSTISFGQGNQLGDVVVRDVAHGNIINVTIQLAPGGNEQSAASAHDQTARDAGQTAPRHRYTASSAAGLPQIGDRNRARMIEKVRQFWIKGVLEQSLHETVLLDLGLEARHDAVDLPWQLNMALAQDGDRKPWPAGTRIIDVYAACSSELLILGTPGAGKTTSLLDLAADLLTRAEHDPAEPVPVVFNLSSWAQRRQPLARWLTEELNSRYQVPRRLAEEWVASERVLPLLDGLDEVEATYRSACVTALNGFRREHGLLGMVVCSRLADYEALGVRLRLQGAVTVLPLTPAQIDSYLAIVGEPLQGLRAALRDDEALHELAETPLLLSIMSLAYKGVAADELQRPDTLERHRHHLFETYIDRMYRRRGDKPAYTQAHIRRCLTWLSTELDRRSLTVFAIEDLQPDWLGRPLFRGLYSAGVGAIVGLIAGMIASTFLIASTFSMGLDFYPPSESQSWIAWLIEVLSGSWRYGLLAILVGLFTIDLHRAALQNLVMGRLRWPAAGRLLVNLAFTGLISSGLVAITPVFLSRLLEDPLVVFAWVVGGALVSLVSARLRTPQIGLTEGISWSWGRARRWAALGIIAGQILSGIGVWWVFAIMPYTEMYGLLAWIAASGLIILVSGIGGCLASIAGGISGKRIGLRTRTNEGIYRSGLNAMITTTLTGAGLTVFVLPLVAIILVTSVARLSGQPIPTITRPQDLLEIFSQLPWTFFAFIGFVLFGSIIGLLTGGLACIQHAVLRALLLFEGAPLDLGRTLQFATDRLLLRRVGGGFIFIHRLLLEHFAQAGARTPTTRTHPVSVDTTRFDANVSLVPDNPVVHHDAETSPQADQTRLSTPARNTRSPWLTPQRRSFLRRALAAGAGLTVIGNVLALVIMIGLLYAPDPLVVRRIAGPAGMVGSFAVAPNQRTLAVSDSDERIALWDLVTGDHLADLPPSLAGHASVSVGPSLTMRFDPSGKTLAAPANDGTLLVWDIASGAAPRTFGMPVGRISTMTADPTGSYVAALGDNRLTIWTVQGELRHTIMPLDPDLITGGRVNTPQLAFTPDGTELIYLSERGQIRIWRTSDWSLNRTLGEEEIDQFALTPDGNYLAVSTSNGAGMVLRVSDFSVAASLRPAGGASIMDFACDPTSNRLFMLNTFANYPVNASAGSGWIRPSPATCARIRRNKPGSGFSGRSLITSSA